MIPSLILILCLAQCVQEISGATTPPPEEEVSLNVTSQSVYPGFTERLSLNCSFPHSPASQLGGVISVILGKTDTVQDSDFKEIAIISVLGQGLEVKNALGGHVEGEITLKGDAYISYDWENPSASVTGQYRCSVNGLDHEGHPVTKLVTTTLEEKPVDVPMALDKIQKLKAQQDELLSQLNVTQLSLQAAESDLNMTSQTCDVTRDQLTSQLTNCSSQLTTSLDDLTQTRVDLSLTSQQLNTTLDKLDHTSQQLDSTAAHLKAVNHLLMTRYQTVVYNNHYYVMSGLQATNVPKFQAECQKQNGYLVEINDQEEYQMLTGFVRNFPNNVYLGMTDAGHEGQWRYLSSGGPVTFLKWRAGEPDGSSGQNCAEMYASDMTMGDYDCVSGFDVRYICEIPCHDHLPCV